MGLHNDKLVSVLTSKSKVLVFLLRNFDIFLPNCCNTLPFFSSDSSQYQRTWSKSSVEALVFYTKPLKFSRDRHEIENNFRFLPSQKVYNTSVPLFDLTLDKVKTSDCRFSTVPIHLKNLEWPQTCISHYPRVKCRSQIFIPARNDHALANYVSLSLVYDAPLTSRGRREASYIMRRIGRTLTFEEGHYVETSQRWTSTFRVLMRGVFLVSRLS